MPSSIMLFCAGLGTRMGALTRDTPKPLLPVAGRPLVDYAVDLVRDAKIENAVANVHYHADQMAAYLGRNNIRISNEVSKVLETGGGLRHALPLLGKDPVYTLNTDMVWRGPNPLTQLAAEWDPDRMDGLLLLLPKNSALGHTGPGDFSTDQGRISRTGDQIYLGTQIIKTERLHEIASAKFSLNVLWDLMIARGRLYGTVYNGDWVDVGAPRGIELAEKLLVNAHV